MTTAMRWGLGLLLLALLLLGGLYAYLRYDNYRGVREVLRARTLAALGSELTVAGPVDVEVGADTRILLRDLTLTNPDPQFLRSVIAIDEARISVETAEAIGDDFSSAVIELFGVHVEVEPHADNGGLPPAPTSSADVDPEENLSLPQFDRVRAHDLSLEVKGLIGSQARELNFELVALERYEEGGFRADIEGRPRGLATKLFVEARPLPRETPGARWHAEAALGDSDLDAVVELRAGRRLFARAVIESDRLDLADLDLLLRSANGESQQAGKPLFAVDDSVPYGWLNFFDASFEMRLRALSWGDAGGDSARMSARLDRGLLVAYPIVAELGEGHLTGSARLDATTAPVTLELESAAEDADAALILAALTGRDGWRGTLDGDVSLESRGATFRALRGFSGRAKAQIVSGAIAPSKRSARVRAISAVIDTPRAPTLLSCAASSAVLRDGRVAFGPTTLVTDEGRLALAGEVELVSGKADLVLYAAPDRPRAARTLRSTLKGAWREADWQTETVERNWLSLVEPAPACTRAAVAPR